MRRREGRELGRAAEGARLHGVCGLLVGVSTERFSPAAPVVASRSIAVAERGKAGRVVAEPGHGEEVFLGLKSKLNPHLWSRVKISVQGTLGGRNVGKTPSETEVSFKKRKSSPGGVAQLLGACLVGSIRSGHSPTEPLDPHLGGIQQVDVSVLHGCCSVFPSRLAPPPPI